MSTIVFKAPGPTGRNGMHVPEMSGDAPIFKGRKGITLMQAAREIDASIADLSFIPCSFWACTGPKRPKHMATCTKCWAIRALCKTRDALHRAAKEQT